ncbi:hypothetical protein [Actinomycetospora termitidis]|uniref:DUF1579 domain-containing protein n=1 Tax=Actinomycetospora termitidis TaxID=3053470 RepID=A0ABT7M330_9PSEU|nr:hypothetical protein [Actinomycetospora sp. Odt1-22]MDL5154604.1 hypothetical protein [Actinomycetospora sp. Odt1-22]
MRRQLEAIVGTWRTEGEVDDGTPIRGTDAYEWLGEEFVVHHVDVHMGEDRVRALEVIGPISASPVPSRAFGSDGTVEDSVVELTGDGHLGFGSTGARAVLRVDGDTATGVWHRTGADQPWMTLRLTRS